MARLLMVDDYPDALDAWSLYLRACGFEVSTANDGATALDLVAHDTPDLAILDLELPGLSGFELARRLRAGAATCRMPLIAVSGYSQPGLAGEAQRAGFDLVLTKPCEPERLRFEIQRLLSEPRRPGGL